MKQPAHNAPYLLIDADVLAYRAAAGAEKVICFEEDSCFPLCSLADAQAAFFGQLYAILDQLGTSDYALCFSDDHNGGFRRKLFPGYKANRDGNPANPGSARTYSKGDGFYLGGFLNGTPQRYVMVDDTGITLDDGQGGKLELKGGKLIITAPAGIESTSPTEVHHTPSLVFGDGEGAVATMNADMQINGSVTSTGDQVAGSISQMQHTHTGVQTGSGNTGKPQ